MIMVFLNDYNRIGVKIRGRFMERYYLGIDIGASSGRHMLGHMENGKMVLEEVYRFSNGMKEVNGEKIWDVEYLFAEILQGMKMCKRIGKIPYSVGIDTWAVDFALLDMNDRRLGNVVAYRDERTKGMDEKVYGKIAETELYARTGIQKQIFNTIYQLMALKCREPELLVQADKLLLLPDYFHFLLTGNAVTEYTNATTTQLVSPATKDWDWDLILKLGYPTDIFTDIVMPGTDLGDIRPELAAEIGYTCKVIVPATHDTASAVMAVPAKEENVLYISSGTWSLMGTELMEADCSQEARVCNLTNEGGYDYRFRYLKNIMGLWMIQSVKKEIGQMLSYGTICERASRSKIISLVECNDDRFLAPDNMTEEIQKACRESNQQVPIGIDEVAAVIYNSLAKCYVKTKEELERLTGKTYQAVHIVGGGANAAYLNQLVAKETGVTVYAGPTEATAAGNIAAQMIACGELKDLQDARRCIADSFEVQVYDENIRYVM